MKKLLLAVCLLSLFASNAQEKVNAAFYDGIVVGGYVDNGGYLNFTGPNINATYGESKFILGMLPSVRFKEDKGATKNSFVFPTLGFGLTYSYKALAVQIPFYYNAKTATENGQWNIGIGIGLRLNKLYKNKQ
ncbi:MAG: hypothetical protein QM710_10280 [Flavobacterium sp.]